MQPVIGLEGSGADIELTMVRKTERAYLLRTCFGKDIWLPQSVFEDNGILTTFGRRLYQEKLETE